MVHPKVLSLQEKIVRVQEKPIQVTKKQPISKRFFLHTKRIKKK